MDPLKIARFVAKRFTEIPSTLTREDIRQEAVVGVLQALRDHPEADEGKLVNLTRQHLRRVLKAEWKYAETFGAEMPMVIADDGDDDEARPLADHCAPPAPPPPALRWTEEQWGKLLGTLSPQEARVIEATYRRSEADEDIAAALGIKVLSVQQVRHQAHEKLEAIFGLKEGPLKTLVEGEAPRPPTFFRDAM